MKSIIVLGLTYNQIPLIQKAQEMGYRAVAIGVGGGERVASQYADAWFPIDTSDKEAVLDLAEQQNAHGIVTCGTSTAMCTVAYVTEKLRLSDKVIPYEVALNSVFKDRFRNIIGDLLPRGASASRPEEAFGSSRNFVYPLTLKPGDGGGAKGITVIRESDVGTFARAFDHAREHSRSGIVIAEEFIEGPVLGAESLVLDGKVHLVTIADKVISPGPRCITLGIAFPSGLPEEVQERIRIANEAAITRLGIRWGLTHIDMVVDKRGQPRIIDIGPRLAGGPLMARLAPDAYDYDFYKATIQLAIGQLPGAPGDSNGKYYGSRFLITSKRGILRAIGYSKEDAAKYAISGIRQLVSDGAVLNGAENDGARLMMFTTKAECSERVFSNLKLFGKTIKIDIDREGPAAAAQKAATW